VHVMVLMLAFGGRGIEGDAVEDLSIADALFDLPHEIVMGAENPASCIVGKDSQVGLLSVACLETRTGLRNNW